MTIKCFICTKLGINDFGKTGSQLYAGVFSLIFTHGFQTQVCGGGVSPKLYNSENGTVHSTTPFNPYNQHTVPVYTPHQLSTKLMWQVGMGHLARKICGFEIDTLVFIEKAISLI